MAARRPARARLGGALPRRRPGAPTSARARSSVVADVTDLAAMVDAAQGVSAVVHLAGIVGESTWPAISHANIEGTYATLEAARRAGVQRVVLASSNHATGFTPAAGRGAAPRGRRPAAPRHLLRRREGDDGGAGLAVRRPLRHGRRLPADRQRVPGADDGAAAGHLALPRRHRLAGRRRADGAVPRLLRRLGRLGQHAQLVGPHRRPGAGLRAGRRRRGLRRGADRGPRRGRPRRSRCTPGSAGSTRCPSSTPRTSRQRQVRP